jgi:hypothetical protein
LVKSRINDARALFCFIKVAVRILVHTAANGSELVIFVPLVPVLIESFNNLNTLDEGIWLKASNSVSFAIGTMLHLRSFLLDFSLDSGEKGFAAMASLLSEETVN